MAPLGPLPATRAEFVRASRTTVERLAPIVRQINGNPIQLRRRLAALLRLHERLLAREETPPREGGT